MLLLECLEVRKDIFRVEQPGTLYIFALIRGLKKDIFAKLLVSFDRKLDADYFGVKIRKIEPVI